MRLIDVVRKLPTDDACRAHLAAIRWPDGVKCPRCGHGRVTRLAARRQFTCAAKKCRYRFSATSGTIFHASHIGLQKWFLALALVTDMKKGTPSLQLHRELQISRECAWHMGHRIREAMREDTAQAELFRGIVQCDEHYHGGSPRKSIDVRTGELRVNPRGRGSSKQPIFGVYEKSTGSIRTSVIPNASTKTLRDALAKVIDFPNTELHTDEWAPYRRIGRDCKAHRSVSHCIGEYVSFDGATNNGVENAWSLFARAVMGSFHKISVKHLPRYLAEFDSRFNARNENGAYFPRVLRQSVGRRLPYRELTAEPAEPSEPGRGA